ncbi:hypothetical protein ElyMa_000605800, partial [Elysia marginata]
MVYTGETHLQIWRSEVRGLAVVLNLVSPQQMEILLSSQLLTAVCPCPLTYDLHVYTGQPSAVVTVADSA